MTVKIGLSLIKNNNPSVVKDFIREARERLDYEPYFELSYHLDAKLLAALRFLKGRVSSAHAPCPGREFFPTLGSKDPSVIRESLAAVRESTRTISSFGGSILVLHPGYTLDDPVYMEYGKRKKVLESLTGQEKSLVWINEGTVCRPGYCETGSYKTHLEAAYANLQRAASLTKEEGVRLCVENLNPRITYLFQLPGELITLAEKSADVYLCLDIGHFWISSLVHGFDFVSSLEAVAQTGKIITAHIHDNRSILGQNIYLADEHELIGSGNIPVRKALNILKRHGVTRFVIESLAPPIRNMEIILRMLSED